MRALRSLDSWASSRAYRSLSSSHTFPSVGVSSPASRCKSVVLPDPERPVTTVTVPDSSVRSAPFTA